MVKINHSLFRLLLKISNLTSQNKQEAYIVGGFIRDYLLGQKTSDIDIAVTGDSLYIARQVSNLMNGNYFILDSNNGVARLALLINKREYHIDFSTTGPNIIDNLSKRDFTVNAMAVNLKTLDYSLSRIIDPYQGRKDLSKKIIRAVDDSIFIHDSTRLLRAVRLAAVLNFKIIRKTEQLIKDNKHLVGNVPGEQLRLELLKILAVNNSSNWLYYLDKLGLLNLLIPEIAFLKNVRQPREHHWDVFNHSLETVNTIELLLRSGNWRYNTGNLLNGTIWSGEIASYFNNNISVDSNRRQLLKIAALLHDIAKPATKKIDNSGRMRFIGHAQLGAQMAEAILNRLRFSNREIKIVQNLIHNHLRPAQMSNNGLPTDRAIYRFFRDAQGNGIDILFLALADYLATKGPELNIKEWKNHNKLIKYILKVHLKHESTTTRIRFINGNDLINIFGLTPGPLIGHILNELDEAQAACEFYNKDGAISYIEKHLRETIPHKN